MEQFRPLMLGIVGDSASGKTLLTRGVVRRLGRRGVTPICLDDYHRYSRAERASLGLTALDPQANDMALMATHLAELRAGGTIHKPIYDHRTGTLREPEVVVATGLVIVYGLLTLTPPAARELFDLTIYLDPSEDLQRSWRMQRDVALRGYTPASVLAAQAARADDAARFVYAQRGRADMVVRFTSANEQAHSALDFCLTLRRSLPRLALDLLADGAVRMLRDAIDDDGLIADQLTIPARTPPAELAALRAQLYTRSRARFPDLIELNHNGSDEISTGLAFVHELVVAYLIGAAG